MDKLVLSSLLLVTATVIESLGVLRLPVYNRGIETHVVPETKQDLQILPTIKNNHDNSILVKRQYLVNVLNEEMTNFTSKTTDKYTSNQHNSKIMDQSNFNQATGPFRRMMPLNNGHHANMFPMLRTLEKAQPERKMNLKLYPKSTRSVPVVTTLPTTLPLADTYPESTLPSILEHQQYTEVSNTRSLENTWIVQQYCQSIVNFEQMLYAVTFKKLTSISPPSRRKNGMSYVLSGLFLHLALVALSTGVDPEIRREIDDSLGLQASDQERIELINATVSSLPTSSENLKFRWSSRLVLKSQTVRQPLMKNAAAALRLKINRLNGNETVREVVDALNHMVELDSGGAIHDTFDEEDFSGGVRAVFVTTLYLRARWRSAPTLLNGTRPFRDSADAPYRPIRMIRVNDIMLYADLTEFDAEAIEIFYSTPGLSLLMLVPRGTSLWRLAEQTANMSLRSVTERMKPLRIAASLPLYTLRMTLLLPNKLEAMNITHLVGESTGQTDVFSLSHAVQRIMFWAEAGRNAFKDDGLEWDEPPVREIVVDRPYIFYVRWKNITLMSGNFVL